MARALTEQVLRQMGKQGGNYPADLSQAILWSFQGVSRIVLTAIKISVYSTDKLVPRTCLNHSI